MIKPEQIPPDAMYAAWKAMNAEMTLNDAIAAAIKAWPGIHHYVPNAEPYYGKHIILPLTETSNDK